MGGFAPATSRSRSPRRLARRSGYRSNRLRKMLDGPPPSVLPNSESTWPSGSESSPSPVWGRLDSDGITAESAFRAAAQAPP